MAGRAGDKPGLGPDHQLQRVARGDRDRAQPGIRGSVPGHHGRICPGVQARQHPPCRLDHRARGGRRALRNSARHGAGIGQWGDQPGALPG